jgi:hypothetical protein
MSALPLPPAAPCHRRHRAASDSVIPPDGFDLCSFCVRCLKLCGLYVRARLLFVSSGWVLDTSKEYNGEV